jgi:Uma2 family endonuclease
LLRFQAGIFTFPKKFFPMSAILAPEQIIPKMLIYEEWEGKPVYRKNYRQVLNGQKQIEEIMGSSGLQTYIVSIVMEFLYENLSRKDFFIGGNEAGLHIESNSNFSSDIVIYKREKLKITKNYFDTPPYMIIEVDIRADIEETFKSETNYFIQKTQKLREFGVEKVVWIFTDGNRLVIANEDNRWEMVSWNTPVEVIENVSFVLSDLIEEDGLYKL